MDVAFATDYKVKIQGEKMNKYLSQVRELKVYWIILVTVINLVTLEITPKNIEKEICVNWKFQRESKPSRQHHWGYLPRVISKVLGYEIVVSEFELQSC